jgi:hypothetical protein
MDRLKLKGRLLEELLKLLADRRPNPAPELDLRRRKHFTRIVSLIVRTQVRRIGEDGAASKGSTCSSEEPASRWR